MRELRVEDWVGVSQATERRGTAGTKTHKTRWHPGALSTHP